jgi:hypothetical protein
MFAEQPAPKSAHRSATAIERLFKIAQYRSVFILIARVGLDHR